MSSSFDSGSGRKILFVFVVLAIAAAAFLLPGRNSKAASGLFSRTESHDKDLPNYDIRLDKSAFKKIASYRSLANKNGAEIADTRDAMVRGEASLKQRVPTLKVEYNSDLQIPEVIAPDVKQGKAFLTKTSNIKRSDILKDFLNQNSDLVGARSSQVDSLKVFSDYTNPDGNLSFVELNQEINGIPVFRGEIKAGFTGSGEIIRVINNFAPGLDEGSLSTDFGDPVDAVRSAAVHINNQLAKAAISTNEKSSTDLKIVFGNGDFAPTAEKMYFPTESGVAVAAWRVLIWQKVNAFYIIVDAKTGTMLWRKNITEDQTQPATYNVYANPGAMVNVADSPFPMTPGPIALSGTQGMAIPRTLVTRVGNEPPYTFNNLGWITDGNDATDGNNVQAGLDRESPNGGSTRPDDIDPNGTPAGSSARVFDFPINPGIPTNPALNTGDEPLPPGQNPLDCLGEGTSTALTDFQKAAVTQLFYIANVYHDELYTLGFTEEARNFQNDNFGRGGLGGDRVSAHAQDCGGQNNANFGTPADGTRPTMQMYLWAAPTPDFDGSLDADVIIHELTHGTSNRLHGNGNGLSLDIARGMGEGWSDFFGHCLLSEPTDPLDGIYTTGAYDTYRYSSVGFNNYYYGIRRFPKAIKSSVGGPQSRPHNPLTFADIDSTQIDITDGAFPPRFNVTADQVHAIGEVWSSALWEVRAKMIQRLGWAAGNRRILQLVMDGMKMAPLGPTPISERDSIIAAAFASGNEADLADIWAGFAIRGLGAGASMQETGGISTGGLGTIRVTESFDPPNLAQTPTLAVNDSNGDNDGYIEPGEDVTLTIPLTNSSGAVATGVSVQVVGGSSANYGTMSGLSTATQSVTYRIPVGTTCGSPVNVTLNVNSSIGPITYVRSIFVGKPSGVTPSENFDGVTAPALPTGWEAVAVSGGPNFVSSTTNPDSAPNAMFALNPTSVGGGTDLTSPYVSVTSPTATLTFRHTYDTEEDWDGGVLEINVGSGGFKDILTAGGSFVQNGYNGTLGGGRNNPVASRAAWTGNSAGYLTTIVQLPASANGKIVQLRWRFGSDDNTDGTGLDPGWRIDGIALSGAGFVSGFTCSVDAGPVTVSGRVLTSSGFAMRNASVTLIDGDGVTRKVTTGTFGTFQFDNVVTPRTYTLNVSSKRYRFATQTLDLTGVLSNIEFIGLE